MLGTLWQDVRYGLRVLLKKSGFTIVAVLTLALGIGANTAIFSVINTVILRPLPYENPEQLVRVGGANVSKGTRLGSFSPHDFFDWRDQNSVFENLAAYDRWSPSLTGDGEPERIEALKVSSSFFNILRHQPARGRTFLPHEDQPGSELVAVLSHRLWQRRFNSDPSMIGQQIMLSGINYTIIGSPASFKSAAASREPDEPTSGLLAPDLSDWPKRARG